MSLSTIEHLPDELLSTIFERPEVPLSSLYAAAKVSRRLHFFIMPLYLSRFHIKDPTGTVSIILADHPILEPDALCGLNLALAVTHIDNLTVNLEPAAEEMERQDELFVVRRHLNRLRRFLARMQKIRKITFKFKTSACCCCFGEAVDEELYDWTVDFSELMNTILASACEEVEVQGARYMVHAYSYRHGSEVVEKPPGALKSFKSLFGKKPDKDHLEEEDGIDNVLKGSGWHFARAKGTGDRVSMCYVPEELARNSKLKVLDIQTVMFAIPPVSSWTMAVLRYGNIQTLSLSGLAFNRRLWVTVWDLIASAAPNLPELKLSRLKQVGATELAQFLCRLTKLRSLHIAKSVEAYDSYDMDSLTDFPYLEKLYAPAGWVSKLLQNNRFGLVRLRTLGIVYHMRNDGFSHWLRRSYPPTIPTLLKEQQRPLTISLDVYIGNNPGWRMSDDISSAIDADRPNLQEVTSLTLIMNESFKVADLPLDRVLPQWLSLFYGLTRLEIRTSERAMSPERGKALMQLLYDSGALAAVQTVELNGEELHLNGATEADSDFVELA